MGPGVIRHVLPFVLPLVLVTGCRHAPTFENHVLTKPGVRYSLGVLPPGWARVKVSDNDVAWYTQETGYALSVNSTCRTYEDAPLDVLTRHLLMGFTERQPVDAQTVVVDEREALRSRYRAKLDGVPVELLFLVLKKDDCVYDFTYVAPLGHFGDRVDDFDALVRGFHAERTS